jgi:pimeloyl-ACP methyl ester carboxylesterase
MAFVPSYRMIEGARAERTAFVLHGVLGSGQNFTRFIQRLAERRPEYRFALLDLRHHGRSSGAPPPNTLEACAMDLLALAEALGTQPRTVIGHSFGGKVAIEYARVLATKAAASPSARELEQVWVLDAVPGAQPGLAGSEIAAVIAGVRAVPMPALTRKDVVRHLMDHSGLSSGLAEWMATNLKREGERYEWVFDLDAIEELLADYFRVDHWDFLAEPRERPQFRLVVAERSDRWPPAERERARRLPSSSRVFYHELPNSGHWVHVDNPDALLEMISMHMA